MIEFTPREKPIIDLLRDQEWHHSKDIFNVSTWD